MLQAVLLPCVALRGIGILLKHLDELNRHVNIEPFLTSVDEAIKYCKDKAKRDPFSSYFCNKADASLPLLYMIS